jgi:hypothetical protein
VNTWNQSRRSSQTSAALQEHKEKKHGEELFFKLSEFSMKILLKRKIAHTSFAKDSIVSDQGVVPVCSFVLLRGHYFTIPVSSALALCSPLKKR